MQGCSLRSSILIVIVTANRMRLPETDEESEIL